MRQRRLPDVLTEGQRRLARERTFAMGERLRSEGYRGYFELDFLADESSGDMPLFLFHLLGFMDVEYEIDVDELNDRWAYPGNIDDWTQFILKQTDDRVERIVDAPISGVWSMGGDHAISYVRHETDWHTVADENEAFYLRIAGPGHYRYPGADLGIMVARGRFLDDDHELTGRARHWIDGVQAQFTSVPIGEEAPPIMPEPFGFKML